MTRAAAVACVFCAATASFLLPRAVADPPPRAAAKDGGAAPEADENEGPVTEEQLGADQFEGLTPAQRAVVLRVMNEKPCDCGCPHGSTGRCMIEDPVCPRAPVIFKQALALAREGRSVDEILARTKKNEETGKKEKPPQGTVRRRIELAKWTPVRGPRDAKVTLVVFSDFQCPFCARLAPTLDALREKYGDALRIAYRSNPLAFHKMALGAAEAAMAAHAQGRFWAMHDRLYAHQEQLAPDDLEAHARAIGLDLKRYRADVAEHRHAASVKADMQLAEEKLARGTPTSFINGREVTGSQAIEVFTAIIDEEIAHADRLLAAGTKKPRLYETMLASLVETPKEAPAKVRYARATLAEWTPVRGPADALVTIVVSSDFQCPFCARLMPTLRAVEKKYGGVVRLAFRNHPLPFHKQARDAARAAMAAHAQGRFWEMHDLLFAQQDELDRDALAHRAVELGLDVARFMADMDAASIDDQITADLDATTALDARGTPTTFVNGRVVLGAEPERVFVEVIDQEIKRADKLLKQGTTRKRLYERLLETAPE